MIFVRLAAVIVFLGLLWFIVVARYSLELMTVQETSPVPENVD